MDLQLGWSPRDQNIQADALTNGEFGDFDPNLRVAVDVETLPFLVLPRLMVIAEELYAETQRLRAAGPPPAPGRAGPRKKLRESDPWGP